MWNEIVQWIFIIIALVVACLNGGENFYPPSCECSGHFRILWDKVFPWKYEIITVERHYHHIEIIGYRIKKSREGAVDATYYSQTFKTLAEAEAHFKVVNSGELTWTCDPT